MRNIQKTYPGIHYHLYSGNSKDVTERLDKGLLDFGILIQPADIYKYDYIGISEKDVWGIIMRKDSPLAPKPFITKEELQHLLLPEMYPYNYIGFRFLFSLSTIQATRLSLPASVFASKYARV